MKTTGPDQQHSPFQFDESPVLDADITDIRVSHVNDFMRRIGLRPFNKEKDTDLVNDFIRLSILTKVNDSARPTLAGLLAFGKKPQRFFPNYTIKCKAYKGRDTASGVIDERILSGTLDALVEKALAFFREIRQQDPRLTKGVKPVDVYRVPFEALREGLVNAVTHRDYTISRKMVHFILFYDRLEIRSPGGLASSTLTLNTMVYRQFTRNQLIAGYLSGWGYIERRGKGMIDIKVRCKETKIAYRFDLAPDNSEFVLTMALR